MIEAPLTQQPLDFILTIAGLFCCFLFRGFFRALQQCALALGGVARVGRLALLVLRNLLRFGLHQLVDVLENGRRNVGVGRGADCPRAILAQVHITQ